MNKTKVGAADASQPNIFPLRSGIDWFAQSKRRKCRQQRCDIELFQPSSINCASCTTLTVEHSIVISMSLCKYSSQLIRLSVSRPYTGGVSGNSCLYLDPRFPLKSLPQRNELKMQSFEQDQRGRWRTWCLPCDTLWGGRFPSHKVDGVEKKQCDRKDMKNGRRKKDWRVAAWGKRFSSIDEDDDQV